MQITLHHSFISLCRTAIERNEKNEMGAGIDVTIKRSDTQQLTPSLLPLSLVSARAAVDVCVCGGGGTPCFV